MLPRVRRAAWEAPSRWRCLKTILPVPPSSRGSAMAASMRQAATIPGANGTVIRSGLSGPNLLIRAGLPIRPRAPGLRGEGGCRVAQNSTAGPYFALAAFTVPPHIRGAFQASSPKTFQGVGASWPHFLPAGLWPLRQVCRWPRQMSCRL